MVVVLEHVKFVLLSSTRVYQSHTSNQSHKTGNEIAEFYTILYCFVSWSHLGTW